MVNNNHPVDIPKTYTVSYFNENEWNKDLTQQEIAQQQELTDLQNQLGEFESAVGPCFVCDLARNNPRWTLLKVVCPADDCPDRYKKREPTGWVHHNCWGDMKISIDGNIRCERCYTSDFMGDWNFACSAHQGQHWPTSHTAFKAAVNVSMDVGGAGEETGFLLYQFLKAHPEKFTRK